VPKQAAPVEPPADEVDAEPEVAGSPDPSAATSDPGAPDVPGTADETVDARDEGGTEDPATPDDGVVTEEATSGTVGESSTEVLRDEAVPRDDTEEESGGTVTADAVPSEEDPGEGEPARDTAAEDSSTDDAATSTAPEQAVADADDPAGPDTPPDAGGPDAGQPEHVDPGRVDLGPVAEPLTGSTPQRQAIETLGVVLPEDEAREAEQEAGPEPSVPESEDPVDTSGTEPAEADAPDETTDDDPAEDAFADEDPADHDAAPDDDPAEDDSADEDPADHDAAPDDDATASAPTAAPDAEAGRERLRRAALSRPSRSQIIVAVLLAALGFAAAVQVRDSGGRGTYEGLRESELIEILDGLTGTAERARDEIARLEDTQSRLKSETSAQQAALEEAQQRARTLNIMAGYVKVTGPGLRITITPGADAVSVGALLDSVQELRTAGAEAIEFNDQVRVVAQSHFDSSNGVITLDGVTLEAPYVIEVIGDPHVLRTGMTFSGGPAETLELDDGANVEIEDVSAVDIESVRAPKRLEQTAPSTDE